MPRSSRHKSHKQSKHTPKESREYSDSEAEDVKIKDTGSGLIVSGEKRKLSSQGHRNGDVVEEYVSSKKRKEKEKEKEKAPEKSNGDRWNSVDGDEKKLESARNEGEKGSRLREARGGDVKSRGSKRHDSGGDIKEDNLGSLEEKEYSRSGSRSEKRKSEKERDGKDVKESREKERGYEKEKKGVERKRSNEGNVDGDVVRKQEMQTDEFAKDGHTKRSKNYTGKVT